MTARRIIARLVCPACESPDGLWAGASFEGWHSVDVTLDGRRRRLNAVRRGTPSYEITGNEAYDLDDMDMGCSCGWEGQVHQLVQLGLDGRPLEIHPDQGVLEVQ